MEEFMAHKLSTYILIVFIAVLLVAGMVYYSSRVDEAVDRYADCQITIKGVSSKLCKAQDENGIYYTNGKIKVVVR